MTDKADHIAWAAEALAVFQRHCRTGDEHAVADLICDLGHLAYERDLDLLSEVPIPVPMTLDHSMGADLFAEYRVKARALI